MQTKLASLPAGVTRSNKMIVTPERIAALPTIEGAHPICFDPSLICTDTTDKVKAQKYSVDLWRALNRLMKKAGPERWVTPANPTAADKANLKLMRQHVKARALAELRWLLVADCEVGEPNLMTGSQLYCAHVTHIDEDGLLTGFTGASARRPDNWITRQLRAPREFIDVTDLFWTQYLRFGRCAKNSMDFREADHMWKPITRTSKRCACCGMWSYRRKQRTVVRHEKGLRQPQERTITQLHVWEHQRSKAFTNPYFHLLRNHPDFQ